MYIDGDHSYDERLVILGWVAHNPRVTAVVVTPDTVEIRYKDGTTGSTDRTSKLITSLERAKPPHH
jgi:hypothetical protein